MTSEREGPATRRRGPRRPPQNTNPLLSDLRSRADQGELWAEAVEASVAAPAEEPPDAAPPETGDPDAAYVAPEAPSASTSRRRVRAGHVLDRPAPHQPEPGYEDEPYLSPDGDSMLRNPYVLAGLAVAAAIVLAVFVVVLFGRHDDGGSFSSNVLPSTPTAGAGQPAGVVARSIAAVAVREGPGLDYLEIGLLRADRDVTVAGRNEDASWYEIVLPDSRLTGWVQASALRLPSDAAARVQVVTYTLIPKPPTPTSVPPTPAPTEEPRERPDFELILLGGACSADVPVTLGIRNVGAVPVEDRLVRVTFSGPSGVFTEMTLSVTLAPGQLAPLATGELPRPPQTTISLVFLHDPQDANPANNVVTCVVTGSGGSSGPGAGSTAVPPPIGSTPRPDNDD